MVEFLDVILDFENECYKPYSKPGDRPLYVNKQSNHPPAILKNIPLAVYKRLNLISSTKEIFDTAAPLYQAELNRAGYDHKLEYSETCKSNPKKRKKNKIWFNPPFLMTLKINVGQKFLRLLDKHFPKRSLLYPIFKRKKLS